MENQIASEMKIRSNRIVTVLLLAMIVLLGAALRLWVISDTTVKSPIRADAQRYYAGALNLKYWGVFSSTFSGTVAPPPGAAISPGTSVALMPFVEYPPTRRMLFRFNAYQAILSTLTILAAYALYRLLAGGQRADQSPAASPPHIDKGALLVALLIALSPHLISMTTYLLTETQFTFLLMFGLLALAWGIHRERPGWAVLGGVLLGLSALTRPTTEYLPLFMAPFLFWAMGPRPFLRIGLPALGSALAIIVAWKIRNLATIGALSDPMLFNDTILLGIYPDFMFNAMPESYAYPTRHDPFAAQAPALSEVFQELFRRAREAPLTYAHWYLIGKPTALLSWKIVAGAGDIFIYPVAASPYLSSPFLQFTKTVSAYLHPFLTVAALIGCGIILFRPRLFGLNENSRCIAILIVSVVLYFLAVHMVGAPFPRYGIPLRPIIYGLGLFTLAMMGKTFLAHLASWRKKAGTRAMK